MIDGIPFPHVGCGAARFSLDGVYRYELTRRWARGSTVCWVMLNPSTADAFKDDATIRRCCGYARDWGYNGIAVVNLFALRSTTPDVLLTHGDPIGPLNAEAVHDATRRAAIVVCAWGAHPAAELAASIVDELPVGRHVVCLGRTGGGAPRHPVRLPSKAKLVAFAS